MVEDIERMWNEDQDTIIRLVAKISKLNNRLKAVKRLLNEVPFAVTGQFQEAVEWVEKLREAAEGETSV